MTIVLSVFLAIAIYEIYRLRRSLRVTRHCYERLRIWTEHMLSNNLNDWRDTLRDCGIDEDMVDDNIPDDFRYWLDRMTAKLNADREYMLQHNVEIPDERSNAQSL